MGSSSSPSLPDAPEFQPNKYVDPNIGFLSSVGQGLGRGNFMPGRSGGIPSGYEDVDLSFLENLVTPNNELTRSQVDLASRDVIRMRDQAQQSILNELEANNQLKSSVTGNRLSTLNEEFSSDISDIATNFYVADLERAMSNTASLFELGLNTTGQATSLGLADQQQENQFNLANYSNLMAASMMSQQEEQGLLGGLLGGAGGGALAGAGLGLIAAPFTAGLSIPMGMAIGAGGGALIGGGLGASSAMGPSSAAGAGGVMSVGGLAAGGAFSPTNQFGSTQTDIGLNDRLMLQQQRAFTGGA